MLLNGAPSLGRDCNERVGFSLDESLLDHHQATIAELRKVRRKVAIRQSRNALQEYEVSAGTRRERRQDDESRRLVNQSIQRIEIFKNRWQPTSLVGASTGSE